MNTTARVRHAFTLIELLVVIAIIGILAGLLLPVVGMIKESANKVACLNGLRQLSMAMVAYTTDNRGYLPWMESGDPNAQVNGYWSGYLASYIETDASISTQEQKRNLLRSCPSIWRCEGGQKILAKVAVDDSFRSYSMDKHIGYGYQRFPEGASKPDNFENSDWAGPLGDRPDMRAGNYQWGDKTAKWAKNSLKRLTTVTHADNRAAFFDADDTLSGMHCPAGFSFGNSFEHHFNGGGANRMPHNRHGKTNGYAFYDGSARMLGWTSGGSVSYYGNDTQLEQASF
jgi:prepilin-type N-terminal cleavage/methylation domain-containing protein